jgi:hypothetical protein
VIDNGVEIQGVGWRSVEGFAIRRLWPDGTHDYIRLSQTPGEAQSHVEADQRYWRRGPFRPVEYRVVSISLNDYTLHRRRHACRSPDCP